MNRLGKGGQGVTFGRAVARQLPSLEKTHRLFVVPHAEVV